MKILVVSMAMQKFQNSTKNTLPIFRKMSLLEIEYFLHDFSRESERVGSVTKIK